MSPALAWEVEPSIVASDSIFVSDTAGEIALVARGAAGQTADVFQVQNNAGGELAGIDAMGTLDASLVAANLGDGATAEALMGVIATNSPGIRFGLDSNLYRPNLANTLKTDDKLHVALELEVDGALNHDGSTVGLYGMAPVARAGAIAAPAGGATIDAEARTAIDLIRTAIQAIGITS